MKVLIAGCYGQVGKGVRNSQRGVEIKVVSTEDYPTFAGRPANSELACKKLEEMFELKIKPWTESLSEVIKELQDV